jgi:hypothetical protein
MSTAYTWTGATSGSLDLAANYSPAAVPVAGDTLTIPVNVANWPSTGTCDAAVTISSGAFITIAGGTYNATVTTGGNSTISGGTFNALVTNNAWINGGTFNGPVINNWRLQVSGTYNGPVINNFYLSGNSVVYNGPVTNNATISASTFYGAVTISSGAAVTNLNGTPVFYSTVANNGTITAGTFALPITNTGTISGVTYLFAQASDVRYGTTNHGIAATLPPGVSRSRALLGV